LWWIRIFIHESKRILKNNNLVSFSVRIDKYIINKKGTKVTKHVYDINGFHIRFFTERDKFFMNDKFDILKIIGDYGEPENIYLTFCYKN
jgi:hypothetical protein